MNESLLLVLDDEAVVRSPSEIAEQIARRARFADALRARGQLRDHGWFRPSKEGVRVHRDRVDVGPFGGKVVAGYYWVAGEAALTGEDVAVRAVMKGVPVPDKDRKPGKIFAFVVIGPQSVMDLIDAETQSSLPDAAFVGGNRLHPPRRAPFDGPFLESKEIVGGVFFRRMASIEDAVRWAAASRFVVHGALEIRELWRS